MGTDDVREKILAFIDGLTAPGEMTKPGARDLLDELIGDLEGRIEALEHEIEEGV